MAKLAVTFRGFGRVEQRDTESVADFTGGSSQIAHHVDPVVTKTWFHTGAWLQHRDLQAAYAAEGWQGDTSAPVLAPSTLPSGLTPQEQREATRALRGSMLRQEIYAEDGDPNEAHPYTVTTTRYEVRQLQPVGTERHGVYMVVPAEARTAHYERNPDDPRVGHQLTLEVDDYGQVLQAAQVAYPRRDQAGQTFRSTRYELSGTEFSGTTYDLILLEDLAANYFVMIEWRQDHAPNAPDNLGVRVLADPHGTGALAVSADARTLQLQRDSSSDGAWNGVITVVECLGNTTTSGFVLKDVVEISLPADPATTTAISVDTACATFDTDQVAMYGGWRGGGATSSANYFPSLFGAVEPQGTSTVRVTRHGGTKALGDATMLVYVVEWGSEHTIQRSGTSAKHRGI